MNLFKMKSKSILIVLLVGVFFVISIANAQPLISISSNGKVSLAGQISVPKDVGDAFQKDDNEIFTYTPAQPLKGGDVIAATVSDDQSWSVRTKPIGTKKVQYPVIAMVRASDGIFYILTPGVLKLKVDIKAGEALHSNDYDIETKRSLKAGDSIPVLHCGNRSLISVEAAEGIKKGVKAEPWFTAFLKENSGTRNATIEAWRIEMDHVKH